MKTKRPTNANVFNYRFPIPAIISILHRVSGVILFFAIPLMLFILATSLSSPADFERVSSWLQLPIAKFIVWGLLSALFYHLFAGIRHLVMDLGFAESLVGARASAKIVMACGIILAILTGVWLW